jgi:hypothetical protein
MSEHTFRRDRHRDMICVCCGAFEKNVNAGAHFSPDCDEVRRDHPSLIYWVSAELRCNPAPIAPPADESAGEPMQLSPSMRAVIDRCKKRVPHSHLPRPGVPHAQWCDSPLCGGCGQSFTLPPTARADDYAQRRAEIAKRRNPWAVAPTPYVPSPELLAAIERYKRAVAHRQTDGIARAVANLNDHEKRLGASRFQP